MSSSDSGSQVDHERLESLKQESNAVQLEDNPYLSGPELMQMLEKQKIVEEMAQAAAEAEAAMQEQAKQNEKDKQENPRDSLMMFEEEDKTDF